MYHAAEVVSISVFDFLILSRQIIPPHEFLDKYCDESLYYEGIGLTLQENGHLAICRVRCLEMLVYGAESHWKAVHSNPGFASATGKLTL